MPAPRPTPPRAAATPGQTALPAFLRGIERRAFVFGELQCGDPDRAERAVVACLHAFPPLAGEVPLNAWALRFWSLLLGRPELRDFTLTRQSPGAAGPLAALSAGPRAALLLRLVAGLDMAHAAEVVGVSEAAYRFALARALGVVQPPHAGNAALRGLREAAIARVKALPEARLTTLAAERERALRGQAPATPRRERPAPPWLLRALRAGVLACAIALLASFLPVGEWARALLAEPGPPVVEALPPDPVRPAPVLPSEGDVLSHPDFDRLADPQGAALADELALLAWLAVNGDTLPEPLPPLEETAAPERAAASEEGDDAP
jgi:hypothetical protein